MKPEQILSGVAIFMFSLWILFASYNFAWSDPIKDKDYCYDQVGDGHFCFDTKQKCRNEQKSDDIAESPCYNKDRA